MGMSRGSAMPWVDATKIAEANPPKEKEARQVEEYRRRKAKPKFYVDENFPPLAIRLLQRIRVHVITADAAGLKGHPDENRAALALKNGYILLTCDRDYLDERRFPLIHCPAIVVFDFGSCSVTEISQSFRCLRTMMAFPQVFDKWVKIDAKRYSWTEYMRFLDGTTARSRYRIHRGRLQEWLKS